MQLSDNEKSAIDRDNRQYQQATGTPFSALLQQQVLDPIESSAAGITADARDVNGVALAGVVASRDKDAGDGSTLTFAWRTLRFHNGKAIVTVAGGSLALSPSTTNYVEVDRAGTVSKNTTGFTGGRLPLWEVTTGAASYADSGVVGRAVMYTLIGSDGVDGSMLSVAAQTKEVEIPLSTLSATDTDIIVVPAEIAAGSKLTRATVVFNDTLAANDTNYWDFGLVNKGLADAGTQAIVDRTAAANSTKATGGSAITARVPRDLTLATLTAGTERDVTGRHVLQFTATKTGAPANLTKGKLLLEFAFEN